MIDKATKMRHRAHVRLKHTADKVYLMISRSHQVAILGSRV